MIVGVHITPKVLGGQRGKNLVHVHVRRCARARLVDIDREMFVKLTSCDTVSGPHNGMGDLRVKHPQLGVGQGRSLLHTRECINVRALQWCPRNREILHCALSLCTVQCGARNTHLTHRVVFDAVIHGDVSVRCRSHDTILPKETPLWKCTHSQVRPTFHTRGHHTCHQITQRWGQWTQ